LTSEIAQFTAQDPIFERHKGAASALLADGIYWSSEQRHLVARLIISDVHGWPMCPPTTIRSGKSSQPVPGTHRRRALGRARRPAAADLEHEAAEFDGPSVPDRDIGIIGHAGQHGLRRIRRLASLARPASSATATASASPAAPPAAASVPAGRCGPDIRRPWRRPSAEEAPKIVRDMLRASSVRDFAWPRW
jgi:hypothetical protein